MKNPVPVVIKHEEGEVLVFGKSKYVAPASYKILKALVGARGKIVTRKALLDTIYNHDSAELKVNVRTVDQGIYRIRQVLGKASKLIVTVNQRGYKWVG